MNMFKQCGQLFAGLVWIPTKYEDTLANKKNDMQL